MGQQSLLRNARVPAICPKCHAPALYRSHSTSRLDNIRRNFSPKRKFRCHTCDWRGWLDESQLSYPSVSIFTSVTAVAGEDVDIPSIRLEEEGAAADRYRMIMPVGTQVIIGDTMYMEMHGQQTKVPIPEGTISQWRDPMKIRENRSGMSAEFLGEENVAGQRARKYRVRHTQPEPGEFLYWIDREKRPLQLQHSGETASGPYTMTLVYSRFDDPGITIDAP